MKLRDTLSGDEKTVSSEKIGIYLCGVTVYDYSHIGHARTIITFDVLRRYLEAHGADVKLIQNFTDIDDKIIERASTEGVNPAGISLRYIRDYDESFSKLNVMPASEYPKVTDHIPEIIRLVSSLVDSGAAYTAKNGVYFAVSKFARYGALSKRNTAELRAGARVEIDADKRDPLDFALWKFAKDEPFWESPWGRGRPGWHVECSAMSLKYLGSSFEIHGGGRDLVFPHHENELAQSEAHTGKRLAHIWMHVGMVTIDGQKMAKSAGNIRSVKWLLERWSPGAIRMFCLGGHYSQPIDYSPDLLAEHERNWDRVLLAYHRLEQYGAGANNADATSESLKTEFDAALDSNLDTHAALGIFYRQVTHALEPASLESAHPVLESLTYMAGILGLHIPETGTDERARINILLERRQKLREEKKYGEADRIRDELASDGITIKDEAGRTIWIKSDAPPLRTT